MAKGIHNAQNGQVLDGIGLFNLLKLLVFSAVMRENIRSAASRKRYPDSLETADGKRHLVRAANELSSTNSQPDRTPLVAPLESDDLHNEPKQQTTRKHDAMKINQFDKGLPIAARVFIRSAAALLLLALVSISQAQPPAATTTDKTKYAAGESITVNFSHGPGNTKDWVGVYPAGVTPGTVSSTIWDYVDGTQDGTIGKTDGSITFASGLSANGDYVAYFFENDGYTVLASVPFSIGAKSTIVTDHDDYFPGADIVATFAHGPGHPKDWIAIYPDTATPGSQDFVAKQFTDGGTGQASLTDGSVTFAGGLPSPGSYVAYLLEATSNQPLASNAFVVVAADAPWLNLSKRDYATTELIVVNFKNGPGNAKDWIGIYPDGVTPGSTPSTIWLYLDGTQNGNDVVTSGRLEFPGGLSNPGKWVAYLLENDQYNILAQESFTISAPALPPNDLILPDPIYLETFDSTPEGALPAGWTVKDFTEVQNPDFDFGDLNSATFADWVVIAASRFTNSFLTYSTTPSTDYLRVLSTNSQNVVNGQPVLNLATGNFLFATSGYRNGLSQVDYVFTRDFDLTGKTNVFLSYHSLYEQNQDSIGAVEYSIDQGTNWLPIVYMINTPAIIKDANNVVDAVATFNATYSDVATYLDPDTGETIGGNYGAFIGAPITQDLAPYISGRVDDDPIESKRVEFFQLPKADNQSKVRFRLAYAGTDSWYFGIDDFGLYSLSTLPLPRITQQPTNTTVVAGDPATLKVVANGDGPFTYQWYFANQPIPKATGPSLVFSPAVSTNAGSYYVKITNSGGSTNSETATLTVLARGADVIGLWQFNNNLNPERQGTITSASPETTAAITFATSDGTTVPNINGNPVTYLDVPVLPAGKHGLSLEMPTQPNGGGNYLNHYTMVWDLLIPDPIGWTPLFNSSPDAGNDADFYVSDTGALGIGALGYTPDGTIQTATWYRIAFAADLALGNVTYYVNGTPVDKVTGSSLRDGRFALDTAKDSGPDVLLFTEPTGTYNHELLINSFLFVNRALTAEEIQGLGGPSAAGISFGTSTSGANLTVTRDGNNIHLTWSGGTGPFQVQKATRLTNPDWQNVGAPTSDTSYTEAIGASSAFFRVAGH